MKPKLTRLELVGAAAALLAIGHVATKRDGIDQSALILLGVAALCFLLPDLATMIARLRKVKWGEFEAEFDAEIGKLEAKVVQAEEKAASEPKRSWAASPPLHNSYVSEYQGIISSPSSAREKIVLAAILAERMLAETVKELGLDASGRTSARNAVRILNKEGFISSPEVEAFDEFWRIRNAVVHGEVREISDKQLARILDLLWRLVTIFG